MNDDDKKYAYQLKERKQTAKLLMERTAKVVNGTVRINNAEIIGKMKSKKK